MEIYDIYVRAEKETRTNTWERALEEDSNRALDWLWLAEQVDGEQRRFAVDRARAIDAGSAYVPAEHDGRLARALRLFSRKARPERSACEPCV